jgi:hypothetical protein
MPLALALCSVLFTRLPPLMIEPDRFAYRVVPTLSTVVANPHDRVEPLDVLPSSPVGTL